MPLGLPDTIKACLFDLDGVLTPTAKVHAAAWKQMFDEFLEDRDGDGFTPFDEHADYNRYVDGKPRYDGVRSFLQSRDIPDDDDLVTRLGDRKNDLVLKIIAQDGVEAYPGSVRYLHAVRDAGLKTAVVSASANCLQVIQGANIEDLLDVRVDGAIAKERDLKGKPEPDTFVEAARELDVPVEHAAVFEDALAGVQAGRAGGFGIVVGVDRVDQADELKEHGADVVVQDLDELLGA